MNKNILAIGIIILFILSALAPITFGSNVRTTIIRNDGNTLYVGGSGPGNYTSIQDAIDNASDGDTIYIPSGIYYENIVIKKSISLVGEDKNTTIIDGSGGEIVVYVLSNWVNISGFTIKNSSSYYNYGNGGIFIDASSFITITDNIITKNKYGIYLYSEYSYYSCTNNTITRNIILNNNNGIFCDICTNNNINNIINSCSSSSLFLTCFLRSLTSPIMRDNSFSVATCWRTTALSSLKSSPILRFISLFSFSTLLAIGKILAVCSSVRSRA